MADIIGCFPVSASKLSLAHEAKGKDLEVIGVTIQILILTEHVHELPEPFKRSAQSLLYQNVVEKD